MMKTSFTLLILILLLSIDGRAQSVKYLVKDEKFYLPTYIVLFESGRYEFIKDEICYSYIDESGVYKVLGDTIQLNYFEFLKSEKEILTVKNSDEKIDVSVQVFSIKDSSMISDATVFARDTTSQRFEMNESVNSNGELTFSIPKGNTIKFMHVFAEGYRDCSLTFSEKYDFDYRIKIYLGENPNHNIDYVGPTNKGEYILKKGKNKIIFFDSVYKKVKKNL